MEKKKKVKEEEPKEIVPDQEEVTKGLFPKNIDF